jgi:hypothetical protein
LCNAAAARQAKWPLATVYSHNLRPRGVPLQLVPYPPVHVLPPSHLQQQQGMIHATTVSKGGTCSVGATVPASTLLSAQLHPGTGHVTAASARVTCGAGAAVPAGKQLPVVKQEAPLRCSACT